LATRSRLDKQTKRCSEFVDPGDAEMTDPIVPAPSDERRALAECIQALERLSEQSRTRILKTLMTYFEIPQEGQRRDLQVKGVGDPDASNLAERPTISPKQFLLDKRPTTDVDRIACLAFYLSHFRAQTFFKTQELTELNTEAAQPRLSNPSQAVDNAAKTGLLVATSGGQKQLSALGELYVQALPDIDRARASIAEQRPKRKRKYERPNKNDGDEQ
jgi:hypothetical protein